MAAWHDFDPILSMEDDAQSPSMLQCNEHIHHQSHTILWLQVSAILVDGKEQQKYTTVCPKKKQEQPKKASEQPPALPSTTDVSESKPAVENLALQYPKTYLLSHPEAPYLKPALLDVKELARCYPEKIPPAVAGQQFPDMKLIYAAVCT